ncbi:hypothetical protein JCM18918_2000 [Cutibacterium acnes JCM 18918]|nr:hypothetical protein JCM18918_2000 [Cutibacterium acnes JCM 18918]
MSGQGIGEILTTIASLTPAQQSVLKKSIAPRGTSDDYRLSQRIQVTRQHDSGAPQRTGVLGLVEREKLPAAGRGRPYWGYTSRTLSGPNSPADLLRHLSRSTIRWIRDTSDDPVAAARSLGEHLGDDALAMANVPDHTEHSPSDKFSLADHMTKIRVFLTAFGFSAEPHPTNPTALILRACPFVDPNDTDPVAMQSSKACCTG